MTTTSRSDMATTDLQRTPEWHESRKLRITGSRIGAILGLSPWQTPDDILRAMVREYHGAPSEFVDNPAVQHGRNHEDAAMLAFMRETGLMVERCGFYPCGDRMGASPDGITSDAGVLELKVPFSCRDGRPFKPLTDQPHYRAQVQTEILATGLQHAYFAQYRAPRGDPLDADYVPEAIEIERVEPDPQWWDDTHAQLGEFYRRLLAELDNPEHLEPLRVEIDTPEAGALLAEVDAIRERRRGDEAREKAIVADLTSMAGEKNALIHGRKLTLVKRRGSIAYAKAIAELLPDADLEKWRGKGSESWRLT